MFGEDSGIEVAALGGRPGVESARWADDGVAALLEALEGVEDRRARYVCELVALSPEGEELRGTGTVEGTIALEPRGSEGFGYDPIFVPDGESRTVAELGNDWKAEHSHRARAATSAHPLGEPDGFSSGSSRPYCRHQFSSAPKTITFAITYSQTSRITGLPNVFSTGLSSA